MLYRIKSIQFNSFILCIAILFTCSSCNPKKSEIILVELDGQTMGTNYMVKFTRHNQTSPSDSHLNKQKLKSGIEKLLLRINQQMSVWQADSEISKFNQYKKTDWFTVSVDTAKVIKAAIEISEKTEGAFDITIAPLINLWGFGPQNPREKIPSQLQINEVKDRIGYQNLSSQLSPPALKKNNPEIQCNLSAIAKGFGVDEVANFLDSNGIHHYLVEIGGEVKVKGMKSNKKPWRVAILSPGLNGKSPYQKVISLKNNAMATSGDYFNYVEKDGVRYSHTIDPQSGYPITHKLASVTVIHHSCMMADAWATAIDVMGPERGYQLALSKKLAVYLIIRKKEGFQELITPEFKKFLSQ